MNGTSVMTGIGIVNTLYTRRLLHWMVACSSAINEIVQAYDDHLSFELNNTKKEPRPKEEELSSQSFDDVHKNEDPLQQNALLAPSSCRFH